MRTFLFAVSLLATLASANWIEIDWRKVRSIEDFDHYWDRLPTEMKIYRQRRPFQRITNGQEATPGQFPYQIVLLSDFPTGTALCGGSVLTRNFILTAAHCVVSGTNTVVSGGIAIMGAHNRTIQEASQQRIRYTASGIRYHPLYVSSTLRYDIAVVLLNSSITFTDRIQPVRLPARSDTRQFGGFVGTLSGFGRTTDASQSISTVVRFTSNPVMTNANCITRWGSSNIQDQNVCLSGTGGRSSCNGDSGGPLTVESGGPMQIGVVSFVSIRGCEVGMPSVYSRVSFYLNWVEINSDFVAQP